jgi:hypothetical protein
MKACRVCGINKTLTDFNKKSSSSDGYRSECRECQKKSAKSRYDTDPNTHKQRTKVNQRAYTAKKFGLTLGELDVMYARQDSKCAICGITEQEHGKYLAIDHCHRTGKVRGLLCMPCNTGLGNFGDRSDLLMIAIMYLGGKRW